MEGGVGRRWAFSGAITAGNVVGLGWGRVGWLPEESFL